MKIKQGFISNSSTSSFIIAKKDENQIRDILTNLYDIINEKIDYEVEFIEITSGYLEKYDWWLKPEDLGKIHIVGQDNDYRLHKFIEFIETYFNYDIPYRHGG